jgi:hypothetical protein
MTREVVLHTWCDIEFNPTNQDEAPVRVDAKTITWYVQGERWEIDLCLDHERQTSLDQMDDLVLNHGRAWEDPTAPPKRRKKSGSRKTVAPEDNPLVQAHLTVDKRYVCDVNECARGGEPLQSIKALRMPQLRAHGMTKPKEGTNG